MGLQLGLCESKCAYTHANCIYNVCTHALCTRANMGRRYVFGMGIMRFNWRSGYMPLDILHSLMAAHGCWFRSSSHGWWLRPLDLVLIRSQFALATQSVYSCTLESVCVRLHRQLAIAGRSVTKRIACVRYSIDWLFVSGSANGMAIVGRWMAYCLLNFNTEWMCTSTMPNTEHWAPADFDCRLYDTDWALLAEQWRWLSTLAV